MERERRFIDVKELRAVGENDEMVIEGRAIVYGQETDLGWFREVIDKGAATEALKKSNEFLLRNHNPDFPAARRANKTLEVWEDDEGVMIRADVSKSEAGPGLYKDVKSGLIDKMSFAFTVEDEKWEKKAEEKTELRRITAFRELFDYSGVTYPGYQQTQVQARSAEEVFKSREPSTEAEQSGTPDETRSSEALEPYYKELEILEEYHD